LITVGGLGATSVGTPEKVADEMERWVNEGDVDGFNIVSHQSNQTSFSKPSTKTSD
jgi:alkanesulfonate monooxygenase SsuD/methylene tetrahydromethanopterin reductase-like flavin-dependent oxidoreductase (luciferase family)